MTVVPFMHVGLLVADIDEAIDRFGRSLGVDFTPPAVADMDNFDDFSDPGAPLRIQTRWSYSRVGPPYYELIEAQERGIFGRHSLGVHHIGMWEADCDSRLAELTDRGLEVEWVERSATGRISTVFFKPSSLVGMRLEILDEAVREVLEATIRS